MDPTYQPDAPRSREATAFADVMRSVLNIRAGQPVNGPDALETWTDVDGYTWQWATRRGSWTVTAGAMLDPRARVRGPAGDWTADGYDGRAGELLVALLRLAGAIPDAPPPRPPARPEHLAGPGQRNATLAERRPGDRAGALPEALAWYWRPGTDPFPPECSDPPRPGDEYVAVALVAGALPGFQAMLLPDGSSATLTIGRPTVLPLLSATGATMAVQLDPVPAELGADQPDHATAVAVIQAHRAAAEQDRPAPPAGDLDADLALTPDDPAIAAARAAEAAAGVDPTARAVGTAVVPGLCGGPDLVVPGDPGLGAIAAGASDAGHHGWRPPTGQAGPAPAYDPPPTGGTTGGYGGE